MPEPIPFRQQNATLHRGDNPQSICELPIYGGKGDDGRSFMLSCWRLTIPEIERLKETGIVWVYVMSNSHPPIALATADPFA